MDPGWTKASIPPIANPASHVGMPLWEIDIPATILHLNDEA